MFIMSDCRPAVAFKLAMLSAAQIAARHSRTELKIRGELTLAELASGHTLEADAFYGVTVLEKVQRKPGVLGVWHLERLRDLLSVVCHDQIEDLACKPADNYSYVAATF